MKRLLNKSKSNSQIAGSLRIADSFYLRLKGLMFDRNMAPGSALFFQDCRCIHTCFMNFAIDTIFVDQNFVAKKTFENIKPWRFSQIVWQASSVIELPAGTLKATPVDIGDVLYVGD